ncbi:MAG: D-glycero-beta-D-manno-heptose-7-phosphate kinase [Deltaproteobacteria bacterium]|nr:D-glycero-beta-D-manno-heptose-7-phosphate kinase [Deltaproteobacteria bacterium]
MIKEIGYDYHIGDLKRYIDHFSESRVLVIGDIISDRYIWGDVSRISPEAPVPVVEVKQETIMLGGAANVLKNISSLGGKSILCGVIGEDHTGKEIIERLNALNVSKDSIIFEPDRPTSIKTRIIAHNQQVVRFDRESRKEIGTESIRKLLGIVKERLDDIDAIIVADYGKGVISVDLMKGLKALVEGSDIILGIDPKTDNFKYYEGMDVITPNHHEAGEFCRMKIVDEDTLLRAGRQMIETLHCRSVLITQGRDGMTLFENSGEISHIPTVARKVFDVTGAGDTVISTLCLGLAAGMDLKSAAIISNFAAGLVVGEVGTSTVTAEELQSAIANRPKRPA